MTTHYNLLDNTPLARIEYAAPFGRIENYRALLKGANAGIEIIASTLSELREKLNSTLNLNK